MKLIILDRRYWLIPLAIWTAVALASLTWNLSLIDRQLAELGAGQAREVFRMMESVRLWNARHGGVYVLQDADSPPNPFLDGMEKEVVTRDGRRLTLVNPAYMTRQVAETIRGETGIQVRITSLKPINPGNAPDPWERETLLAFERGVTERAELIGDEEQGMVRYMAPLLTRVACLECHAPQGYEEGDVRGGISVSFPVSPIAASQRGQTRNAVLVHLVAWVLVAVLTVFALSRSRAQLLALDRARHEQEALVELRTAELRQEVIERRQAETRLRLLMDACGSGIFGVGPAGECSFINPVALRLLGVARAEDLSGAPILQRIVPVQAHAALLADALRQARSLHSEALVFQRADGSMFNAEVRFDPIEADGGAVVSFADITQRKAAEASVWHQANFDALTGLPNRSLLRDRLEQIVADARRNPEIVALLFIDLDGFKEINDTRGHAAGDAVLRRTAGRLQASVRDSDTAARLAGDEFVVVLRHLDEAGAAAEVAAKLLDILAEPIRVGEDEVAVSASIGVALFPRDAATAEGLLRCADQAMYWAKEAGKQAWRDYLHPHGGAGAGPAATDDPAGKTA